MDTRAILRNGLIDRNPGFVQLLGLCPLLAVSTSVASALGLGLATIAVLLTSNAIAALAGPRVPREVRLAVFVLMIAAAVTSVELAMAAWWPGLHAALGIFLPSFIFVAISNPLIPRVRDSAWISGLLDGVNVAALGLMAAVTWQLGWTSLIDPLTIAIAFVSLGLLIRTKVNSTWLISGGAIVGLFRGAFAAFT